MKIVALVQARMGSTRLPNKVMKPIVGVPLIELLISRLACARRIDEVVLATSNDKKNVPLISHVKSMGYPVWQGSEDNVLDRFYRAARGHSADVVVRITGDCPLVEPELVDMAIEGYITSQVDYYGNCDPATYPDGLDVEVFSFAALSRAWSETKNPFDMEHVTPYFRTSGKFRTAKMKHDEDLSALRWTVDDSDDFEVIEKVFQHFHPRTDFSWLEVLAFQRKRPEIFAANRGTLRNEGMIMSTGQKLWKRARKVIPGGCMLLSKRAEMFLPEHWPAYFSKAKGCKVWDLDGREYLDMSIMGIGTNTLGYGHPNVDDAVREAVSLGNMSTLNCKEEVFLAEKLVELHPWADMVRLARTGGEADAIAVRIARAAAGKSKIAFCGYHGWHDWYLAANLGDGSTLAGHLLPGLEPHGVPESLRDTIYPFNYNRFEELDALVRTHNIGVIIMEVSRNMGPDSGFLEKVRKLATDSGIVLIFDECTSGFRQTNGGLHKLFGVEPDIAIFGKALGNGYAITAVVGRLEVMEAAQSTFISSTFWTERIGPAAALKTLEVMEQVQSWERITQVGQDIKVGWQKLAEKYSLSITTSGIPALASFSFNGPNALNYKTLITQEMLKKGYLAGTSVYVCTEHTPNVVSDFFNALDSVFALIKECEDGRDVASLLNGPVCHSGFRRLN